MTGAAKYNNVAHHSCVDSENMSGQRGCRCVRMWGFLEERADGVEGEESALLSAETADRIGPASIGRIHELRRQGIHGLDVYLSNGRKAKCV